jgi:mRNA interferase MazF
MADGYFERGEVHWVKLNDAVGFEEGVGRPGVIVSANEENNVSSVVNILYTTTSRNRRNDPHTVFTRATLPRESWVLCNQIHTVDKSRLNGLRGKLTAEEMRAVDDKLEKIFDLGYVDDTALKEKDREIEARDAVIAEKDTEIGTLKARVAADKEAHENELLSYKVELEMFRKLYERSLDQLVKMKLAADVSRKTVAATHAVAEPPKNPPKEVDPPANDASENDGKVDVNHCTITALKKLGFSLPMARLIVSRRPYKTVEDLKSVPGLKSTQYRIMEPKLCCTPMAVVPEKIPLVGDEQPDPGYEVEPVVVETPEEPVVAEEPVRKVNVNTATLDEMVAAGINKTTAQLIRAYRNKNGVFSSLEDLMNVSRCGSIWLKRHRDKLEV